MRVGSGPGPTAGVVPPGEVPQAGALPSEQTAQRLGAELIRMVKVIVSMREYAPSAHPGVDFTHYPVLFALAREPQRVSDLAGCVHADVSTVSRQVSHLVEHGLVAKSTDPQDGRAHRLVLTDAGRTAIATVTSARGRWLQTVMADWSESDSAQFVRDVCRFADSLERAKAALTRRS